MPFRILLAAAACLAFLSAAPAAAQPSSEAGIRSTVARWYEELLKKDKGHHYALFTPASIDASPPTYHARTRSRAAGPLVYGSLAARALRFSYEIDSIRRDSTFAKVQVWERGYFYAAATQTTFENAAATTFILERSEKDGRWRIAAHQSSGHGIPPHKITRPLPDLRNLYYSTVGKDRDPVADARDALKW
jgi:hypothetical protein